MMQYVGRRYVPYINYHYGTSGSLWEGRYKSNLIDEDDYLLVCMRYIELNPVRAEMVSHPRHYRWSSYRVNAEDKEDKGLKAHRIYQALGRTVKQRKAAYRELFKAHIEDDEMSTIRNAWQTGTPFGNDRFKERIEAKLQQCKVGQARRGRPSKRALPA